MALTSSAEQPLPVRTVARAISDWIGRLGRVWIEGQIAQLGRRPGTAVAFLTLRDPVAEVSVQLTCRRDVLDGCTPPLVEGARVVVWAKPTFYLARGTLSLEAYEIRPVGLGELLARIERLKTLLAAEGLFAAERKRRLPFLPRVVGLVCGRASAAEHDVVENAKRRWPAVRFRVEPVAVQGPAAALDIANAIRRLDKADDVDVIVLARGGGSVEDLLPFSDEGVCRGVAACRTPIVSAIGHQQDTPLVDLVADVRASTPTDAGKLVVPDVAEQQALVSGLRERARRALVSRLDAEERALVALRSRPVLAEPEHDIDRRAGEISALALRAFRCANAAVDSAVADLEHTRAQARALSPAATLDRGYAVVQRANGTVVRDAGELDVREPLDVRVAAGRFSVEVTATEQ
ncbi:MAG: exodeoxyribonuclease VII large subunit [Actinomycetes bacterium]